jgi:outer membrane protein assembly factor BamD
MRIRVQTPFWVMLTASVILLAACGGKKEVPVAETFMPEASMARADQLITDGDYEEGRKVLVEVKNRDTSKKYAQQAQLKIADSYVREGEPDLGIEEYRKFLEMYPASEYAATAQYQIAMAYYRQIESPEKLSGAAQRALQEFWIL